MDNTNNAIYYLNAAGEAECPGDACMRDCDEHCPIYCNTLGLEAIGKRDWKTAGDYFTKATRIYPRIKSVWNNQGIAQSQMGRFKNALYAYQTAYRLDNHYQNAIYGVALTLLELEQYDECQDWCDEYIQQFGWDDSIIAILDKLRDADASEAEEQPKQAESAETSVVPAMQLLVALVDKGYSRGLLAERAAPNIPEIWVQADDVVNALYKGIAEPYDADDDVLSVYSVLLGFSIYAGIGAVALWNVDWDGLKTRGIYRSLAAGRGIDYMDEYVTSLLGVDYESDAGQRLMRNLQAMMPVVLEAAKYMLPDHEPQNTPQLHECMKALFLFGAVMETQNLGMR